MTMIAYNKFMNFKTYFPSITLFLLLVACQNSSSNFIYEDDLSICPATTATYIDDVIPIQSLTIPNGDVLTNPHNFIQTCESEQEYPLVLAETDAINHQLVFRFDAIYPISRIEIEQQSININRIEKLSVDFSTNGLTYTRILPNINVLDEVTWLETNGFYAQAVKMIFPANAPNLGFTDIRFIMDEGFIAQYDKTYSDYFLRTSGWTGADGIFTYDLNHGGDEIGVPHQTTGFVFSDTFVGEVNPETYRRQAPVTLINNSFGYLDHDVPISENAFSFDYDLNQGLPISPIKPESYMGHQPRNLLDADGFIFSQTPEGKLTNQDLGISWLSTTIPNAITLDFFAPQAIDSLYLWNYNANPSYGAKAITVYAGLALDQMVLIEAITLLQTSGNSLEPYTQKISFPMGEYRYVKIEIHSSYHESYVGLGKLLFLDRNQQLLYANIQALDTIVDQPDAVQKPRLWLQDGFVAEDHLYNFPLLIKNANGFFTVNSVGMIAVPIAEDRFQYQDTTYFSTPLMTRSPDNGVIYFGAGVMDHRPHDGYIYVYGYKDLQGRNLVAGRFILEDLHNFNAWEFYTDEGWQPNIHRVKTIKSEVSAELSVTRIGEGYYAGKYILTVMKNTLSGTVAYAIGDSPIGPFGPYQTIYQTLEHTQFKGGFTYNAKLHPNLSTHDKMWISYNVNSTDFSSLMDANIYYPRFISIAPIKSK